MAPRKLTNAKKVRQVLKNNRGLIALSADDLEVSYNTIKKFIDADPPCQDIIRHAKEKRRDRAERRLDDMIDNGEAWAIALTLKGDPSRGYSDKIDVTNHVDEIIVKLVTDDNS
jgi:hypothetical protein